MLRNLLIPAPALLLWAGLATAAAAQQAAPAAPAPDLPPRPAKLMTLSAGDDLLARDFYGRVEARRSVDLAFQVGGQITEFPVSSGDRLERGELIARLDLDGFERQAEQARLALGKAERDLERLEALRGDTVSRVQIEDARTQAELARIDVATAEDRLADATLSAPFDALVASKSAETFQTVQAGTPVVRLHDMSELRVAIDVPEVLFRSAAGEEPVELYATLPGSEARYPLEFREYEAETAQIGQTYRLILAFAEAPGDWVLPGASVTVTAASPFGAGEAMTVPETALVFAPDRSAQVLRFAPSAEDPDLGTVHLEPVEIEVRADARVALVEGPEPGTEIVATGAAQLRDGQTVRRFTAIGE
ncbi:efflux RND transporter periplasmic adaptor subunit [Roseivivax sp. CAU 1761]